MKLSELLSDIEHESSVDTQIIEIENVTTKIGEINNNTLFVIINGINFDTGKIIDNIIKNNPAVLVCDRDWGIDASYPIIRVKNSRCALAHLCSKIAKIEYSKLKFIGVTGTNGKTTTATMIEKMLNFAEIKSGFIGTGCIRIGEKLLNNNLYSMTTPDPEILYPTIKNMQNEGCKVIVMEVSSHALALQKVAPIHFECSIFTNLSDEHLDFHKDKEDYYNTKLKLFSQSKNGIFNADDEYSARAMRDTFDKCNTTSVGVLWEGSAMARDVIFNGFNGSSYIYREKGLLFKATLSLPGYYNIYNSLLALKCVMTLGVKPCIAKEALKTISKIDGRFEVTKDSITVIIDYAHTESATQNILKTINSTKSTGQNVITVFGCGGERDKFKRPRIGAVIERYSDEVIITNDNPRNENEHQIISDIISGMNEPEKRKIISSREEAINRAIQDARDGDIVLILGKGHERYIIDNKGYHPFDERVVIKRALKKRKSRTVYK